jgi:hypothetical protein
MRLARLVSLAGASAAAQPSWHSFAGTNYGGGASMPDVNTAQLGFVRDPLGPPWLWAEWPVVGHGVSSQPPFPNVTAMKGPFTQQFIYMDFAGVVRKMQHGHSEDGAAAAISALGVTGLPSLDLPTLSSNTPNTSAPSGWDLLLNHTQLWKDIVYTQVYAFNSAQWREKHAPLLHWQLGNEINGCMFNAVPVLNTTDCSFTGPIWNSAMQREAYANLFFGPTAEAVRRASTDAYGEPTQVQIVLGSVANAFSERSLAWLDSLLGHEIVSPDTAPSLHGKRVVDVVQIASVHYLVTHWSEPAAKSVVPTTPGEQWQAQLDRIATWLQPAGPLAGVWATEEHGKSGYGVVTAWKVLSRWLQWWVTRAEAGNNFTYPCAHSSTGHCTRGKASLWGTDLPKPGGAAIEGMAALGALLGNAPLSSLTLEPRCEQQPEAHSTSLETQAFCTSEGGIAALIWRRETAIDSLAASSVSVVANVTLRGACVSQAVAGLSPSSPRRLNASLGSAVARPQQLRAIITPPAADDSEDCVTIALEPPVRLSSTTQDTLLVGLRPRD